MGAHYRNITLFTPFIIVYNDAYIYIYLSDDLMRREIFAASDSEKRAATLFLKNFLKSKTRRSFLKQRGACIQIQKIIRGYITRIAVAILAEEYAEYLLHNPRDEDVLYPDDKRKKKKGKIGKGKSFKKKH